MNIAEIRFNKAYREFCSLAGVNKDPARTNTIGDLVYIAEFEIDLANSGEGDLTVNQLKRIRKFIAKWKGIKE